MQDRPFTEKDWKLFRARLPEWQEAYMGRLIDGYIELLQSEENPSNRFWKLEKRIRQDKKAAGVSVEVRRSMLSTNLLSLLAEGAITLDDLEGFSDDFRTHIEQDARILGLIS